MNLLRDYKPQTLNGVLGQTAVVQRLKLWLRAPSSCAMLFTGPTGVGKTCCATALARELGCNVDEKEMGGFFELATGSQGAEDVREMLRTLRFRPMLSASGWRVMIGNEIDRCRVEAETVWLDGLEHLPPQTLVIFTTNLVEKLTQRFRDRCETFCFESRTKILKPAIQALAKRVWETEVGSDVPIPFGDMIGLPTLGSADSMHASFRLALQQIAEHVRSAQAAKVTS